MFSGKGSRGTAQPPVPRGSRVLGEVALLVPRDTGEGLQDEDASPVCQRPGAAAAPSTALNLPPPPQESAGGPWASPGDGVPVGSVSIDRDRQPRGCQPLPHVLPFFLLHPLCPLCPFRREPCAPRGHGLGGPGATACASAGEGVREAVTACPGAAPRPARELPAAPALYEIICYFSCKTVSGPFPGGAREKPNKPHSR